MENNSDFEEDRLVGYLSGELSEKDREDIDSWRKESPGNEEEFQKLKRAWDAYPLLHEMEHYNALGALRKVHDKMHSTGRRNWFASLQRIAAILAIPLLVYSAYLTYSRYHSEKMDEGKIVWQTITTPPGIKSRLILPDSTKVWLNSSSSISYPVAFRGEARKVRVTGEAFFDVKQDLKQPFIVGLGKLQVKVTGTRFDVIHYKNEDKTEIALESGKVVLCQRSDRSEKSITDLKPGELAVFNKAKSTIDIRPVQIDKYTAWINGMLIFRDDPMDEVVRRLNHWYNVDIKVADPEIRSYIYTATFQNESLDQILELLTISAPIRYEVTRREKEGDGFSQKQIILKQKKSNKN